MQLTPGMPFSSLCAMVPRRSNAARISCTASSGPDTAASAARWETLPTFEVVCDCKLVAALITSAGPIIQPTRQPVMAYVLATPFSTMHRSARSGTRAGME
jgi:hypothetical protein